MFRPGLVWKPRLWLGLSRLWLSQIPGRAKAIDQSLALAWPGLRPQLFQSRQLGLKPGLAALLERPHVHEDVVEACGGRQFNAVKVEEDAARACSSPSARCAHSASKLSGNAGHPSGWGTRLPLLSPSPLHRMKTGSDVPTCTPTYGCGSEALGLESHKCTSLVKACAVSGGIEARSILTVTRRLGDRWGQGCKCKRGEVWMR